MKYGGRLFLQVVLSFICCSITAIELTSIVLPSEDEVVEAFESGEITFSEFIILLELSQTGIDSLSLYLLDEIPNLTHFQSNNKVLNATTEQIQQSQFVEVLPVSGQVKVRYLQRLGIDDDETNAQRYFVSLGDRKRVKAKLRIHKDLNGDERFIERSILFRTGDNSKNRIELGNFRTRFGLGTALGYRGNLLDEETELNSESFLYPDYGGYNGVFVTGVYDHSTLKGMWSSVRDNAYRINVGGIELNEVIDKFKISAAFVEQRIKNRSDNRNLKLQNIAITIWYEYTNGHVAVEGTQQNYERTNSSAYLIEGKHRIENAELRFSGWSYGDNFLDITSGSKSVNIRQTIDINEIDFTYSTRRTSQTGGLLRTIVLLSEKLSLTSSFLHGTMNDNLSNTDLSFALEYDIDDKLELQLDHFEYNKERFIDTRDSRRTRLEARYKTGKMRLRSYIAYNKRESGDEFISFFSSFDINTDRFGGLKIWSNFSNVDDDNVNRWYGYIQNDQVITDYLNLKIKLSDSYSKTRDNKHQATFSIELNSIW